MDSGLLTTPEAARYLRLAPRTLENDRCSRRLGVPFLKLGGKVLYHREDLDRWVQQQRVRAVTP